MVDFNESEGESAFLVVRSTKGVWFDNPHVFHRSLAKVPISFCFAEGAQVQVPLPIVPPSIALRVPHS